MIAKKKFIQELKEKNMFWSYDADAKINDVVLIEQTLIYGEVDDIKNLFLILDRGKIRKVWEQRIVPINNYYKMNYYLGKIFFDIKNIEKFIKEKSFVNSRYERIKKFIR